MAITRERDTQVRSIRELKEELDEFKTAGAKKEEDLNNDQLEAFQVSVVIVRLRRQSNRWRRWRPGCRNDIVAKLLVSSFVLSRIVSNLFFSF